MTILRDPHGVPHVVAAPLLELGFEQGRAVALDRGRQIELDRLHAVGRTAEVLGQTGVEWDVLARRAQVDAVARRSFEGLDRETRQWCTAFVDGVVAGLGSDTLPGGWRPWTPLGIFAVQHLLFGPIGTKLWRAHVADRLGRDAVDAFVGEAEVVSGSNAWAAGGERTASGFPIVAGDPHRLLESPGVYQQVRLSCPGIDVVGFTFLGVPGVQHFAHAGEVAWGITNAMADHQDLLVERLRQIDGRTEALGAEGWEPVDTHSETVSVLAGSPVEVEVVVTARGPVVEGGPRNALSLRSPAWVDGDLGFGALLPLLRARTVDDVDAALDAWVEPVNDVLIADRSGIVRHRIAGRVPVRDPEARVLPVPAWDPRFAWMGEVGRVARDVAPDEVAVVANDRRGADSALIGYEFAPPTRALRIADLLSGRSDLCVADAEAIHVDTRVTSPLVDLLAEADVESVLRCRIASWDRHMRVESKGAAAFGAVRSMLVLVLAEHPALAPIAGGRPGLFAPWFDLRGRIALALDRWVAEGAPFGIDLDAAVAEAFTRVDAGPEPTTWGDAHVWRPAGAPEVRLGGDTDCVLATTGAPGVDAVWRGPVARYAWDLADRDASGWVVPLGASGYADDPHHHDQLDAWAAGRLVPIAGDPT